MRRLLLVTVASAVLLGAVSSADARIYWLNLNGGLSTVGRADLDGGDVRPALVSGIYYGTSVASDGTYIYWGKSGSNPDHGAIGRATVDGGNPELTFLDAGTYCGVFGVVPSATDFYWLKSTCGGSPDRAINRTSRTPGQGVSEPRAQNQICGFAIDATYLYWSVDTYIGRSRLDGSQPEPTWLNTGTGNLPCGVAVDAGHIYWTLRSGGMFVGTAIGRASIAGDAGSVNNAFITGTHFGPGVANPSYIAVDAGHVYWTNQPASGFPSGSIGRANIDGSGADQDFIPSIPAPYGLALDPTTGGPVPAAPAPAAPTPAPAPAVTKPAAAIKPATAFSLPAAKTCASRRAFSIRIRKVPGVTFVKATVKVNGKQVKVVKGARISAAVNLRGLPKGRFTVSITATANDGRTVTGTRAYKTCTKKLASHGPKL